jgi:hypothetical protein
MAARAAPSQRFKLAGFVPVKENATFLKTAM